MIPKPLDPPTQALLQRLDEGYEGIEPDDPAQPWERFWLDLLETYSGDTEAQESKEAA